MLKFAELNFTQRSYQEELLDRNDIPFDDIKKNMQELDFINTWLGGHDITIRGVRKIAGNRKKIIVCEIGCGGGDNLKAINRWAQKKGISLEIIGIDIKSACIDFAKENCAEIENASWICSDYKLAQLPVKPDIVFSSLFCHHFDDDGVRNIFHWMYQNSKLGFFINDLQRHPLAYYSIKLLSAIFSRSYMVKNDAPLSVLRGFSKAELDLMLKDSLLDINSIGYSINWQWAFRWLLIATKENA
jgi:2-polyprenyl-3-methyl-5-hydroxy-6-metoxy-1,4-benzoquinol methylase